VLKDEVGSVPSITQPQKEPPSLRFTGGVAGVRRGVEEERVIRKNLQPYEIDHHHQRHCLCLHSHRSIPSERIVERCIPYILERLLSLITLERGRRAVTRIFVGPEGLPGGFCVGILLLAFISSPSFYCAVRLK
jgi:hypothetical protein